MPRDAVTARRRDGAHAVGPGGGALERVGSCEDAAFLVVVTVSTRSIRSARSFTVKCDQGLAFNALLLRGTVGNARTGTGGHPRVRVLRVSLPLRRAVTVTTTAIVRITNIQIIRTRIHSHEPKFGPVGPEIEVHRTMSSVNCILIAISYRSPRHRFQRAAFDWFRTPSDFS